MGLASITWRASGRAGARTNTRSISKPIAPTTRTIRDRLSSVRDIPLEPMDAIVVIAVLLVIIGLCVGLVLTGRD